MTKTAQSVHYAQNLLSALEGTKNSFTPSLLPSVQHPRCALYMVRQK